MHSTLSVFRSLRRCEYSIGQDSIWAAPLSGPMSMALVALVAVEALEDG